jgi:hypothetical protein
LQDLTFYSIILLDIGGGSIKNQYKKGFGIAASLLKQMGCDKAFIRQVCEIVGTHHDHSDTPSFPFRVLYDSDKLVMFSPEEFPYYNSRADFDWNKILDLIFRACYAIGKENVVTKKKQSLTVCSLFFES